MAIGIDPPTSPAGLVASASALVGSLTEVLWAARTPTALVETVEALTVLEAQIAGVKARTVAEIDTQGIAKSQLHWGSTGDWITHLAGLRRGEGRRLVAQAHQLVTERTETLAALDQGVISPTQAGVVLASVDDLPGNPMLRRRGAAHLLEAATRLDATDLSRTGRHLAHVVDPDRTERREEAALDREERVAHLGRFLSITDDGAGGIRLKGRGSAEDGALLRTALLPLTAPAPGVADDPPGPGADPRDHGARAWDALIGLAEHALATDLPPASHGARPRVALTLDYQDLVAGTGTALGDDGTELCAATARRVACDADLIPVVLGRDGEILDVGRAQRLVTRAQWTALVVRDRGCAFPGCTRPPVMCHAHHIRHWSAGGVTSLANLVLLCGHHHRTIHHTPWQVAINPRDGRPDFTPPPRRVGGPPGAPMRDRPRRE